MNHEFIEKNVVWLGVLIVVAISFGGLVEIVPLMFQSSVTQPAPGLPMRTALQVAGRDVYVHEGCYNCHSQMVRGLHEEVLRYGPRSTAGESVWDHPFQWGSKRTGPDLARVGGRYSDDWHITHLMNPRDVVPESNMPSYPWLAEQMLDGDEVRAEMVALKRVGVPFPDDEIEGAAAAVAGKTKMDALIAFLQSLKAPAAAQADATAPAAGGAS
ncbi:cytochrome-c oxidase, cbb3-type subunit II [Sinimarinibacterium sp. CAU 1509]|uniref:cytochrome-c oxidase, cbb3-type subunit II n=1 Tax=Sinimarinibacterium sp. CAU 1509 TaxID=2562283 RepID=UPI0010ADA3CF|nr:cytochrome-c oxidase, cbb3-type subunit II [Sinimarinibacterium sp. CAU 1509]TJY63009.1 cytochrome-c oxidase, cbb3-type subunit II [Sinimarinibacterium sp. CAU 1509]